MSSSQPIPQPLSHARALRSEDDRTRLMAHALDALTAVVPASAAAISPVDRWLAAFTTGPIVVRVDSRALAADVDRIHAAYLTRAGSDDSFEPRRWATRDVTAIGVGDVGGAPPPCDLLAAQRLSRRAAVFLRNRGRLVAYAVLMREIGAPDPTALDIERLRHVQPLLEAALLLTRERPSESIGGADLLRARGLTGREAEVAALAATGATNAEIARDLYISVNTVKTHIGRALAKLGLRTRTELALAVSGRR